MEAVIITKELLTQKLKKLPKDCNKGSNGTLNIVAGTPQYRGAADLCVGGALRTGVGIVRLIAEEPVVAAVCARHPSCTFSPVTGSIERRNAIYNSREKCFLIGCGLGLNAQTCTDVSNVLATAKKAVLDADALNAVSANPQFKNQLKNLVITPHVGEFSRLTGKAIADIKNDRIKYASDFSKVYGCVTVLKDYVTVIALPSGETFISENASEGLSKGGSGDVLAGLIAGFLAQNYTSADAAILGVAVHALASTLCASENGIMSMLPSDLESYVSRTLCELGY